MKLCERLTPKQWDILTIALFFIGLNITINIAESWSDGLVYYLITTVIATTTFVLGLEAQTLSTTKEN